MPNFKLVNPQILGDFKSTVNAKNNLEAAEKIWKNMAKHVVNNIPRFVFTLENTDTNNIYTFKVDEKTNNKMADYSITEVETKLTNEQMERIKKAFKRAERKIAR
jgi:hypothetical protein